MAQHQNSIEEGNVMIKNSKKKKKKKKNLSTEEAI